MPIRRILTPWIALSLLVSLFLAGRHTPSRHDHDTLHQTNGDWCSGECATCGCAPEIAASGVCCCTLSRLARHPVNALPAFAPRPATDASAATPVIACAERCRARQTLPSRSYDLQPQLPPDADQPLILATTLIRPTPPTTLHNQYTAPPDPPPPRTT